MDLIEKNNKIMQANEKILVKAFDKIKGSEEANTEILTQNEELRHTQEQLMTQRQFIEKQNEKMKANETEIRLKKAGL